MLVLARSELAFVHHIRILALIVRMPVLLVHVRWLEVDWFVGDEELVVHEHLGLVVVASHFSSVMS